MAEPLQLRQNAPLAAFRGRFAACSADGGGTGSDSLRLAETPFLAQVGVRAVPGSAAAAALGQALGAPLPLAGNTWARAAGGREVLWLGPDEWLVVGSPGEEAALEAALEAAVAGLDGCGAAVGLSANRTALELSGSLAREVLASVCGLDLHPAAFGPERCAQTLLASAPVVLQRRDGGTPGEAPAFRILVRPSFAAYVAEWLLDAAAGVRAAVSAAAPRAAR